MFEILSVISTLCLTGIITFFFTSGKNADPIFGIYKQPGRWYWVKYVALYFILKFRKIMGHVDNKRSHRTGYGLKSRTTPEKMEMIQELSPDPKAFEAVFFVAVSKDGFCMIAGSERRHDCVINGLLYLLVPGVGVFRSEKLPNTVLHATSPNVIGAEGLQFSLVKPMREWKVEYEGNMKYAPIPKANDKNSLISEPEVIKVVFHGEWKSDLPYFDFDMDMAIEPTCRALAREDWSKEYLHNLEAAHQTHYEQMGDMTTKLSIGENFYEFNCQSFRDHSYGLKRDWNLMHRYISHLLFLENGMKISIIIVCQPCTCSMLEAGFIIEPNGQMYPLSKCDLQLYQHGENGTPPTDYAFSFEAGKKSYYIQIELIYEAIHFVGNNEDARMVERFVKCQVNGKINGAGAAEFQYNNANYQQKQRTNNHS